MRHEWLIRQVEGLRDYAALNGLAALAEHLDQARLLAQAEIASAEGAGRVAGGNNAGRAKPGVGFACVGHAKTDG